MLGLLTICSHSDPDAQKLATRYFFAQFQAEFTREVLQEFYEEHSLGKQQVARDPSKREFYLALFRIYSELPFQASVQSFT